MLRCRLFLLLSALLVVAGCGDFFSHGKLESRVERVAFTKKVEKVYFDSDKYEIKGPGKRMILELVEHMKRDNTMSLVVIGHADSTGTEEYSMALGEKRANAVKQFILGCDRSLAPRVAVQSRGKSEPEVLVYSSDAKEVERANAQNRRAVIVVEFARSPRKPGAAGSSGSVGPSLPALSGAAGNEKSAEEK
ncbi:MAG: OmpA family protein [Aaplasma endosymbiont of Hyalomma asiaticum]